MCLICVLAEDLWFVDRGIELLILETLKVRLGYLGGFVRSLEVPFSSAVEDVVAAIQFHSFIFYHTCPMPVSKQGPPPPRISSGRPPGCRNKRRTTMPPFEYSRRSKASTQLV